MTWMEHSYIGRPPWARWLQRGLLAMSYSLVVVLGVRGIVMGGWFLDVSGWLMLVGGVAAAAGALGRLYNIESIGLYLAIAGFLCAATFLAGGGSWWTAYVVLALTAFLALRLLPLTRIAAVARVEHEMTQGGE